MNVLRDYLCRFYEAIEPLAFYRSIFALGELEDQHDDRADYEPGRYTGICIEQTAERRRKKMADGSYTSVEITKRYTITDDLDVLDELIWTSPNFCFMSPISYAGKRRSMASARFFYALTVEIDFLRKGVRDDVQPGVHFLLSHMDGGIDGQTDVGSNAFFPRPTYIVCSGNGLHLYYVLDSPLPLYRNIANSLTAYKNMLTKRLWQQQITEHYKADQIEYEPIWQGFRVVGTLTKYGIKKYRETGIRDCNEVCVAYRVGDPVSVDYLNRWAKGANTRIVYQYKTRSGLTLAQAKEKWPDWYQDIVVDGLPKKHWCVSRAVYDSWKRRLWEEVNEGGKRYFCLMTLVIYAVKCSFYDEKKNPNPVSKAELERDCYELMEKFDSINYEREDGTLDHFTKDDVEDALQAYLESFYTYPINSIVYRSGLEIKKNKRNGRTQDAHIERITALRDVDYPDGSWRNREGRPEKTQVVQEWRKEHPDGTKIECELETGLSRHTVIKWWGDCELTRQRMVCNWRKEHPDGRKAECIRDTGLSRPTVSKWWDD